VKRDPNLDDPWNEYDRQGDDSREDREGPVVRRTWCPECRSRGYHVAGCPETPDAELMRFIVCREVMETCYIEAESPEDALSASTNVSLDQWERTIEDSWAEEVPA
jgi:hypothetical protein